MEIYYLNLIYFLLHVSFHLIISEFFVVVIVILFCFWCFIKIKALKFLLVFSLSFPIWDYIWFPRVTLQFIERVLASGTEIPKPL